MDKGDRHRIHGVIEEVRGPHKEDHGILTTWVTVKSGYGWYEFHQGFGGLILTPKLAKDYVKALCKTFNVKVLDDLIGRECWTLYSFGEHNESIEGLEDPVTGLKFIHNAWRKRHFPDTATVLDQKVESIKSEIEWAKRRLRDSQAKLASIKDLYVNWEKA